MPIRSALTYLLRLAGTCLAVGCGRSADPQTPNAPNADHAGGVEIRVGGTDEVQNGQLPFKIIAVANDQKLSQDFPFHVGGGEWLMLDCEAGESAKVGFTVGVMAKHGTDGTPITWGQAVLIVKDQEAGGKFVQVFGKSFPGKMPAPAERSYLPKPLIINIAILGKGLVRDAMGGFSRTGGGWTATKWFPEHDGRAGEVFFNYDLSKREGEFSEKDPEYVDDLLAIWASSLRDGPEPERTPDNYPNLTLTRPTIGHARKLLSRYALQYSFTPAVQYAIYQIETEMYALPLDVAAGEPFEIARFDYAPRAMRVLNDNLDLIVQESIIEIAGVVSSTDPVRIWWIDQTTKEKRLLRGPAEELGLAEAAVSPDLRFVALEQWRGPLGAKKRDKLLILLDWRSGGERTIDLQKKDLSVVGWKKTDAGLRAVAITNRWGLDEHKTSETYLADPTTGKLERQAGVDGRTEISNLISPDGKYQFQMDADNLLLTEIASGAQKHFVFHEDDRPFVNEEAVEWVSPRYLKFNGQRLSLIDVTTMKMCFPTSTDGVNFDPRSYQFSPDFRWVVYQGETDDGEGLFLASVEMPPDE